MVAERRVRAERLDGEAPAASFLDRLDDLFLRLPLPVLVVVLVTPVALVNGVERSASIGTLLRFAASPFDPPDLGGQDYALGSPVGPLLAHLLALDDTRRELVGLHFVLVLAAIVAGVLVVRAWAGDLAARFAIVLLAAGSLSRILFTWLGLPDPFTFTAATVLAVTPSTGAAAAAALLLGFNHFEQGFVIVAGLAVLELSSTRAVRPRRLLVVAGAALLAGRAALAVFHALAGIEYGSDRLAFLRDQGVADTLERSLDGGAVLAVSLFSMAWLLVLVLVAEVRASEPRLFAAVLGVAVLCVGVTVLTYDETRVFALVSWPAVVWLVARAARLGPSRRLVRIAALTALLGLVVPYRFDVFNGRPVPAVPVFAHAAP